MESILAHGLCNKNRQCRAYIISIVLEIPAILNRHYKVQHMSGNLKPDMLIVIYLLANI